MAKPIVNIREVIQLSGEIKCADFAPNLLLFSECKCCSNDITKHSQEAVKEEFLWLINEYNKGVDNIPTTIMERTDKYGALYLGGYKVVMNTQFLKEQNVTHILNAAQNLDAVLGNDFVEARKNASPNLGITIKYTNWEDDPNHPITMQDLYDVVEFIEKGRATSGSVLVHCAKGLSRSPFAVMAYIMCRSQMSADEATALVKDMRKIANPNDGFIKLLQDFYVSEEYTKACNEIFK